MNFQVTPMTCADLDRFVMRGFNRDVLIRNFSNADPIVLNNDQKKEVILQIGNETFGVGWQKNLI